MLFVGEAPGENEDRIGKPFVGRAGQILDGIIRRISIADYGVINVVKCRPPENVMQDAFSTACCGWAIKQIEIYQPRLVVTLGKWSTQFILGYEVSMPNVVGKTYQMDKFVVFPMLHPASILYSDKYKQLFEDCVTELQIVTLKMCLRKAVTWF